MENPKFLYKVKFSEFNRETDEMDLNFGVKKFPTYDDAEIFASGVLDCWCEYNSLVVKIYYEEELLFEKTLEPIE